MGGAAAAAGTSALVEHLPLILSHLGHADSKVRWCALELIEALPRSCMVQHIDRLQPLLDDRDQRCKDLATKIFSQI